MLQQREAVSNGRLNEKTTEKQDTENYDDRDHDDLDQTHG
jgi:hypothetical protein